MIWNCFEQIVGHWCPVSAFPYRSVVQPTCIIVIGNCEEDKNLPGKTKVLNIKIQGF